MVEDVDDFWDDVRPHRAYVRNTPREERVKALAHQLWIARGSPSGGDPNIDWNEAERLTPRAPGEAPKSKLVWLSMIGDNVPPTRIWSSIPNEVKDSVFLHAISPTLDRSCTARGVEIFLTETGGSPVFHKDFDQAIQLRPGDSMDIQLTISISSEPSQGFLDLLRVPFIGP